MCTINRTGKARGARRNCRSGSSVSRSAGTASRATQSDSCQAAGDAEAPGLERGSHVGLAVDEDARGDQRAARESSVARFAASSTRIAGDEVREDEVERALAARHRALARRTRLPTRLCRALARVASTAIGSISRPRRASHRADGGDREDPRAAADVERAAERSPVRALLERLEAQPRRRVEPGPERHPWIEVDDHLVAGASMRASSACTTSRRPTWSTWKCSFHASAQSASSTNRVWSSPIGRSPNAWRWPSASRRSRRRARRRPVASRHVGANRRGPARVDPRAKPVVDELEAGLDARPTRRHAGEDLADRLDGLGIRLDRELQPATRRPPSGRSRRSSRTVRVPAAAAASALGIRRLGRGCEAPSAWPRTPSSRLADTDRQPSGARSRPMPRRRPRAPRVARARAGSGPRRRR